ncbi:MAG: zinc-binding dehydrogenase [Acidobacteria bacterium]|nr:zinc-binding dehydrogenase [Acidobacteriota bacterium]
MFAARYEPGRKSLIVQDIPTPELRPHEVLLKIQAAGICHSDLHVLDGEVPFPNSFTMGHEGCGQLVEKASEAPADLKIGGTYAVHGPNPCGNCVYCRTGHDNLCNDPGRSWIGLGEDGAYADYLKVAARNVVEVPAGVSPAVAAVATDAVLTPYHAMKTLANIRMEQTVLVLGLGGLGSNGVQIALALGAYVIASDIRDSSLELARTLGAHEVVHAQELDGKVKGKKIDVVADFVGRESTFTQAQMLVRPGGIILLIGLGASNVPLATVAAAGSEIRVQGSFWGTSVELGELLRHIADGKIRPEVETGNLEDVSNWLEELRSGKVRSRMALVPKVA